MPKRTLKYVWNRNVGGGQKVGNTTKIIKVDKQVYKKYIKPISKLDYKTYKKRVPSDSYARLRKNEGKGEWKLREVGKLSRIKPRSKKWSLKVKSFSSKKAKDWRRKSA